MDARAHRRKSRATETPIGAVPTASAIKLDGLDVSAKPWMNCCASSPRDWAKEHAEVGDFFKKFGDRLPAGITEEHTMSR
jgi:phosphoenolpyruvate carboxykinase (GTP)